MLSGKGMSALAMHPNLSQYSSPRTRLFQLEKRDDGTFSRSRSPRLLQVLDVCRIPVLGIRELSPKVGVEIVDVGNLAALEALP